MARIPPEEIERIKRDVPIARLVEARGIALSPHGASDLAGLCPFHKDTTPSLVVSPEKNLWHCLGACKTGGSVIDWVMRDRGVSFRHAVEILRTGHGEEVLATKPRSKDDAKRGLPRVGTADTDDRDLCERVVAHYRETLKVSPEALAYL